MLKLQVSMLILAFFYCAATTFGTPIAPATPDGATPIDARVSAAEFGAQDAFDSADSSGESAQAEASDSAGFKVSGAAEKAKSAAESH